MTIAPRQPYRLEFTSAADQQFRKLPKNIQTRLRLHIDALTHNPRPSEIEKLKGEENAYRLRVGDYRVLYEVQDKVLLVLVVKVGHRREVYRKR